MPIGKRKSSKVRDKWQRKILGMPIYIWQPTIFHVAKLRAKWQYRVSRAISSNRQFQQQNQQNY